MDQNKTLSPAAAFARGTTGDQYDRRSPGSVPFPERRIPCTFNGQLHYDEFKTFCLNDLIYFKSKI